MRLRNSAAFCLVKTRNPGRGPGMQKSTSILSQVLKEIPRRQFGEIVDRFKGNAYSKGFTCWDQLVAMLFCQLSGQNSLRDLEFSFNAQGGHHYHLGSR